METTKEYDVVLIPSTEPTDIISVTQGAGKGGLFCREYYGTAWENMGDGYMELLFVSQEQISVGEAIVIPTVVNGEIDWKQDVTFSIAKSDYAPSPYAIKLIASGDKNLTPNAIIYHAFKLAYVQSHNDNKVITKVELKINDTYANGLDGYPTLDLLKVDSENCIMIKSHR